jgi:hypothetical protein
VDSEASSDDSSIDLDAGETVGVNV